MTHEMKSLEATPCGKHGAIVESKGIMDDTVTTQRCVCACCGNAHSVTVRVCEAQAQGKHGVVRCQLVPGHEGRHERMVSMAEYVHWTDKEPANV